jgi:hypothetical protein
LYNESIACEHPIKITVLMSAHPLNWAAMYETNLLCSQPPRGNRVGSEQSLIAACQIRPSILPSQSHYIDSSAVLTTHARVRAAEKPACLKMGCSRCTSDSGWQHCTMFHHAIPLFNCAWCNLNFAMHCREWPWRVSFTPTKHNPVGKPRQFESHALTFIPQPSVIWHSRAALPTSGVLKARMY